MPSRRLAQAFKEIKGRFGNVDEEYDTGFVERLEGSWSNVVGLPLARTLAMLRAHGAVGAWP